MEFVHQSVLLRPAVDGAGHPSDGIYLDGTLGGAGHSYQIAARAPPAASSAWTGTRSPWPRPGSACSPT